MNAYEKVVARLTTLGYTEQVDEMLVSILLDKVTLNILSETNLKEVPKTHEVFVVDRICGEFLNSKFSVGSLTEIETDLIASSVSAGDTSVSFQTDSMSKNDRLQALFNSLMKAGDFKCLRKMRW